MAAENATTERHERHEKYFSELYDMANKRVSWTVFWSIFALTIVLVAGAFSYVLSDLSNVKSAQAGQQADQARQSALIERMAAQVDRIEQKLDRR